MFFLLINLCCIDMFHKTSQYACPQIFHCRTKFPPILRFPPFSFPPKLFSLIFSFFLLFIRLPLLKLLKVKNPFFIAHPTLFFFLSLTHFHFHHVELSLSRLHRPQPPPQPQPPPPPPPQLQPPPPQIYPLSPQPPPTAINGIMIIFNFHSIFLIIVIVFFFFSKDRSFTFILKTPPASVLLLKAAGMLL